MTNSFRDFTDIFIHFAFSFHYAILLLLNCHQHLKDLRQTINRYINHITSKQTKQVKSKFNMYFLQSNELTNIGDTNEEITEEKYYT